jgi:hypothetical protein
MEYFSTDNLLSVRLSHMELWYLASLFGPGWIFGIENPIKGLSEVDVRKRESEIISCLSEEGLISIQSEGKQIQIDEMLGAMVYSCIHSQHILVVKNATNQEERFFHFLPDWQLEFVREDDDYKLTLFKERTSLFDYLISTFGKRVDQHMKNVPFSIGAKDLEVASYLFRIGKDDKAAQIFTEHNTEFCDPKSFLKGYSETQNDLRFNMIFNRDDQENIKTKTCRLTEINQTLYWIVHDTEAEEMREILSFTQVNVDRARTFFNQMLLEK